jgi:hypothetical protein
LVTQPVAEQNNTLTFKIKEVDDEISQTNSLAMYYRNSDTSWTELDLISAVHSKGADLTEYLKRKDNYRAYTAPGDEILLTYRIPPGGVGNASFKAISSGYYLWTAETWCQILDLGPVIAVQPGATVLLEAKINNMSAHELPADAMVHFEVRGPGGYVNTLSVSAGLLAPASPKWHSLNWTVPNDAPAGDYSYSASVYLGNKNITWDVQDIPTVPANASQEKVGYSCQ